MKIVTKYLGTTITTYISLVMLLLLGLHTFIDFMQEFSDIGTGYYGLSQALIYVALMLPSELYQFFPMAGLLGCVMALGLLASHSELIVMRTSGLSLVDIMKSVAKTAAILIAIMLIVGEVIAPIAQTAAVRYKANATSSGQALVTYQGMWVRSGEDFVHINAVSSNKELHGITRYEFDANRQLKVASMAKSGSYQEGKWIFKDIVQTSFDKDTIKSSSFSEQQWDLSLNPRWVGISDVDPDQKSLPKLYSYIKGRKQSGLNAQSADFAFWQRVFAPFTMLIMILLAVPFVFGPLRSTTMGLRMLVGVMVGFGFHIINQFVGPMSEVYHVPIALAAILPALVFSAVGALLLFKSK